MVEIEPSLAVTRELGHGVTSALSATRDDNVALRYPRSVRTFAKLGREDAQVASVLKAVTLPIERASWYVDANGADEEVVRLVAEDLRLPVRGDDSSRPLPRRAGRVSWSEHLHMALLCLQFGHMFFEQVYEISGGRVRLRKLAPRLPGSIRKINVARDGGLVSIVQSGVTTSEGTFPEVTIPVNRLVAYVHDPQDTSWTGTSVLRPAYKHWVLKDRLLRLEAMTLERNGMGVPVYEGSGLLEKPGSDLHEGQNIATALRAGAEAGAAIPAGAKLSLMGVSGQIVSPREAIAYHDSMIARSVLAHFLNLEGKGGSYALADTQADFFVQSLQTIAESIADTATQHIVEDLVDVAFPDYEGLAPRIVFDPIASKKELTAEALSTLVDKGVLLPDRDLEEDTRRRYSLPGKRPLSEAKKENPKLGAPSADEMAKKTQAAKDLIEMGFSAEDAMRFVGLDPVLDGDEVVPVEGNE